MSRPMPENVRAVFLAYARAIPHPTGGPNPADPPFEDKCRAWTKGAAQQIVFSTGDRSWGCKNAGGGRPQSKDSIAEVVGPTLFGYDTLFGVGTGDPSLNPNPVGEDITGQVFMPVEPFDHIGAGNGGGTDPDPDPGDKELEARVAELEAQVRSLTAIAAGQQEALDAEQKARVEGDRELRERIGQLEAKVSRLRAIGPTKGRSLLGFSHFHDADIPLSDPGA